MSVRMMAALSVLCACTVSDPASAAITATAFGITKIPQPTMCTPGTLFSPGGHGFLAWDEATAVAGPLPVDMIGNPATLATATPGILSGVYNSHFLHMETLPATLVSGWIDFDAPIVGVAFGDANLDASDALAGWAGTVYPTGVVGRDFGGPFSTFTTLNVRPSLFLPNRLELSIHTWPNGTSNLSLDQIRVYTAVPTPSGAAALSALGLIACRRRRVTTGA